MLTTNQTILTGLSSPVRYIVGKVEHYRGSTLLTTYYQNTSLQEIEIQRVAESGKFFGMVISQRCHIKMRDLTRVIDIQAGDYLIPYLGVTVAPNTAYVTYPRFVVTEVNRDEQTNQLLVTSWDLMDDFKNHTIDELNIIPPYTIRNFMTWITNFANTSFITVNFANDNMLSLNYPEGANFEGGETVRQALLSVAEATQSVIYVDNQNRIVLKQMRPSDTAVYTITKAMQKKLSSKTNRRLAGIAHVTELGDNVEATLEVSGTTQQVKNNPFWELRDDIADIVEDALDVVGGLTINQFSCDWLCNLFLEIGDKIAIITKDNETIYGYILDDIITFDGGLEEKTEWKYADDEGVGMNSSNLGDMVKQTYARVDKASREVELVASEVSQYTNRISALELSQNEINASVTNAVTSLNNQYSTLSNEVHATMSAEQIEFAIKEAIENDVQKLTTETGFVFDKDGLNITKTGSDFSTLIDDNGMDVSRGGEVVLSANDDGVNAINLTARQYLTIGTHSRFEDYEARTACFWLTWDEEEE